MQGVGPSETYTYWQPLEGQVGVPQPVTILPPGASGIPVTISPSHPSHVPSSKHRQNHHQRTAPAHGGRGKEKSNKGKRNSGPPSGRKNGGADGKHSAGDTHISTVSLLDEFKNKKNNRDWSINDIKGCIVNFCKDQNGSRFVQQRLEVGDISEKEIVVAEVLPAIDQLRDDVFGNYVVQKLLDFGTDKMKQDLRDTLSGEMVPLSMQVYG